MPESRSPRPDSGPQKLFLKGLLAILFLVAAARLLGFVLVFSATVLQMDLAAFYIAGKTVGAGLDPYVNQVETDPALWDGVAAFAHSRFLYPPLAARPFQLLAAMPYHLLKFVWTLASLVALGAAMVLAFRLARLKETTNQLLAVGSVVAVAYPTLTLLERGQVDAFILLLILAALTLARRGGRAALAAGGLLALAAVVKINCIFLVPFLMLQRRWRAALGFAIGGLLLLGLSLVLDGPRAVSDYATEQLPRISEYGELGAEGTGLPREAFGVALRGVPVGHAALDGKLYRRQKFRFVINASLSQTELGRAVRGQGERLGLSLDPGRTAIVFFGILWILVFFWQRRFGLLGGDDDPCGDLAYWQLVLAVLLLCGPITWAMTTVWLLPLTVILLRESRRLQGTGEALALLVCVVGLLAAISPDPYGNFMLSPFPRQLLDQKYVFAELAIIAGLLWFWRERSRRHRPRPAREASEA
jgi:hypothetical protein